MSDLYSGFLYKRENTKGFTWYFKIKAGNKVVLNRSTKTSAKKEAKKILDNTLYELNNGTTTALSKDMTFGEFLDNWIENTVKLNTKYNTYDIYKRLVDKHIKKEIGSYTIKQIDANILQQFINKMFKKGYSKSTLELTRNILFGSIKYAVEVCNFKSVNPVQFVKIPKYSTPAKKHNILTIEQFNKLIELNPIGSKLYIPLQVSFHTGMRRGEVLALKWEDIDLENKIIHVKHTLINKKGIFELGTPKTESSIRDISIGDTLTKILKAHKIRQKENKLRYGKFYKDSDWVCTDEHGNQTYDWNINNRLVTLRKKIDFDFSFHDLRHTHTTMLIEAGANIKDVQARLGHSSMAITMDIYSHVTQKMKNETVDIFERIVK